MREQLHRINCHIVTRADGRFLLFRPSSLALIEIDRVTNDILNCEFPASERDVVEHLREQYDRETIASSIAELRQWAGGPPFGWVSNHVTPFRESHRAVCHRVSPSCETRLLRPAIDYESPQKKGAFLITSKPSRGRRKFVADVLVEFL